MKQIVSVLLIAMMPFATAETLAAKKKHAPPTKPSPAPAKPTPPAPPPAPVPTGTIKIAGQPGVNQDLSGTACLYKTSAQGQILTGAPKCYDVPLNADTKLPAGPYLLYYSSSRMRADLAENEAKVIDLKTLLIPKVDGATKFRAFVDYNDSGEQDKQAFDGWGTSFDISFLDKTAYTGTTEIGRTLWEGLCHEGDKDCPYVHFNITQLCAYTSSALGKAFCAAFLGNDYRALISTYYRFNRDASLETLQITYGLDYKKPFHAKEAPENTKFGEIRRDYINTIAGVNWGSVSVFPGVYGIEYSDDSGATKSEYGKVVQ